MSDLRTKLAASVAHGFRVADLQDKHGFAAEARSTRASARKLQDIIDGIWTEPSAGDIQRSQPLAGDIGEPIRHVELPGEEPLTVPEEAPDEVPVEAPTKEPVPA